ncbi:unnamed protein product [Rotaria sp. Silwood2]|nr:unnamed protein product [Rotaria sp. Silwood2]
MQTVGYLTVVILLTLVIGGIFGAPALTFSCPPGRPMTSTCPGDENATCVSNYCGGCNAVWYGANGRRAKCFRKSRCPPGQHEVQCLIDPCEGATCSAYPNATCIPDYCGGCNAEWFTTNEEQVQCEITS